MICTAGQEGRKPHGRVHFAAFVGPKMVATVKFRALTITDEPKQSDARNFNLSSLPRMDFYVLYIALPLLKAQMETRGTNVAISFVTLDSKLNGRPNKKAKTVLCELKY